MRSTLLSRFKAAVTRGRRFERRERRSWARLDSGTPRAEVPTTLRGRRGRIDIRVTEAGGYISIIELKATDWDRVAAHRVRPTALRHARQVWRYANAELVQGLDVCAGIIYERAPGKSSVRQIVQEALNERVVQVVWRASALAAQHATGADARLTRERARLNRGRWADVRSNG